MTFSHERFKVHVGDNYKSFLKEANNQGIRCYLDDKYKYDDNGHEMYKDKLCYHCDNYNENIFYKIAILKCGNLKDYNEDQRFIINWSDYMKKEYSFNEVIENIKPNERYESKWNIIQLDEGNKLTIIDKFKIDKSKEYVKVLINLNKEYFKIKPKEKQVSFIEAMEERKNHKIIKCFFNNKEYIIDNEHDIIKQVKSESLLTDMIINGIWYVLESTTNYPKKGVSF